MLVGPLQKTAVPSIHINHFHSKDSAARKMAAYGRLLLPQKAQLSVME